MLTILYFLYLVTGFEYGGGFEAMGGYGFGGFGGGDTGGGFISEEKGAKSSEKKVKM